MRVFWDIPDLRFYPFIIPNFCESEVFELRAAAAAVGPSGFGRHVGVVSNRTWQQKTCGQNTFCSFECDSTFFFWYACASCWIRCCAARARSSCSWWQQQTTTTLTSTFRMTHLSKSFRPKVDSTNAAGKGQRMRLVETC